MFHAGHFHLPSRRFWSIAAMGAACVAAVGLLAAAEYLKNEGLSRGLQGLWSAAASHERLASRDDFEFVSPLPPVPETDPVPGSLEVFASESNLFVTAQDTEQLLELAVESGTALGLKSGENAMLAGFDPSAFVERLKIAKLEKVLREAAARMREAETCQEVEEATQAHRLALRQLQELRASSLVFRRHAPDAQAPAAPPSNSVQVSVPDSEG